MLDGQPCEYCGVTMDVNNPWRHPTRDHIVPRSRGGEHTWENVVAACRRCNSSKRDRYLHETSMRLRRAPRPPQLATWFFLADRSVPSTWEPYLAAPVERSA